MNGKKPNNVQKIVSVFILWCMTVGSIAGIFTVGIGSGSVPQPVANLIPSVINDYQEIRDWGIYDADYSITINSGGTLKIINSTLNFPQDDFTDYSLTGTAGGSLILENSTITTGATPQAMWDPMFEITLTDFTLKMADHSALAFPGWLNVTGINSHVFINDSWITSLEPTDFFTTYADNFPSFKGVVDSWWAGTPRDLEDWQDDGPRMSFLNCNDVTIADSRIDELYEDADLTTPLQNLPPIVPDMLSDNGAPIVPVTPITILDGSRYTLASTHKMSTQFTTLYNDADYSILAAYLYVVYNNPSFTYAPGFGVSPWNYFNISIPGSVPDTPIFQIAENRGSDWAVEYEVTPLVNTFNGINNMFVNFTPYDNLDNNPVNINIIAINLTVLPVHPTAALACSVRADNSEISVINSYISADWTSAADNYEAKNVIALTNAANLYMYNATISEDEDGIPGIPDYLSIPVGADPADYVPVAVAAGCQAYYFKWLDASVVDKYDAAVPGARLNATFDFTDPATVNAVSKINNLFDYTGANEWDWAKLRMTNYLNRMYGTLPASFNNTPATGKVMLPLLTTYFNQAYYPNGDHVGEYNVNIFYTGSAGGYTPCDFQPMPNIASEANTVTTDIQLTDVELPRGFGSPGLIVNGTMVMNMNGGVSDSLAITDFIIVEDTGRLTISNANMLMSPTGAAPFHITVRDSGVLILNNVDLRTLNSQYLQIKLEDDAMLNMTDSTTTSYIDILAKDDVLVNFNRTELGGNFDTTDGANVRLWAWSTMFNRNLDDLHGTTEVRLIGCYSPLSPNFKVQPSDSAKVWIYRWAEITVYNGQTPAKPLLNANIWLATQYPGWGTALNRAGNTNLTGVFLTPALSDYLYYSEATSEVVESHYNLYSLVTRYQLAGGSGIVHNETTGLGLAAFPAMGFSDATAKKSVVLENVLPDLDPPIIVWPPLAGGSGVGRGNTVLINATVTNEGDATATNAAIRFQDIFNGQTTQIYTDIKDFLAPGQEWAVSFPYTWSSVSQIGWHNLTVMVDPNLAIKEQDETNNDDYLLIEVTSQADLAMLQYTDVRASETYPLINHTFDLYANIWNQGDINATDVLVSFYANGALLGNATAAEVPANPAIPTVVTLPVIFTQNGTYEIEVYIDALDDVSEVNEANNNNTAWPLILRVYQFPDLFLQTLQVIDSTNLVELANGGGTAITETYNRTHVALRARVGNRGDLYASQVFVRFYDGPVTPTAIPIGTSNIIPSISTGNYAYATFIWEALTDDLEEVHTINAIAYAAAGLVSNQLSQTLTIYDNRADLEIVEIALANDATTVTGNTVFNLNVTITNNGLWTAEDVAVDIYSSMDNYNSSKAAWNSGNKVPIGRIGNATITTLVMGETEILSIRCTGIDTGDNELFIFVDTDLNNTDAIEYDDVTHLIGDVEEYDETNNNISWPVTALMPPLFIDIQIPLNRSVGGVWTQVFTEGKVQTVQISGYVLRQDNANIGVPDVPVTVTVEGLNPVDVTTTSGGFFSTTMAVSTTGNYSVEVSGNGISTAESWFRIDPATIFPWWIIILIIILVVAVIVGITLYLYFVGLGKTVQCGDCGAFIPEGAAKCPKCGVEFEKEVAKCSVCGAWVPIDVKNCPECKTEFTVGTQDLDDYEAKMKRQYDDIVRKFRNEAKKELGQEFTETEFQAWWASKPTFITFDQWLKEEEEMKRMGSKPCPVCEMENSVTAKICHKCGSVMGEAKPPKKPEGKMPPAEKKPEPAKPAAQPQPQSKQQAPPTRAAPAPQPAPPQPTQQAAPVPAQQPAPAKKGCPSCGMEVNAAEKICPICNYDFSQAQSGEARRIIRKPIKKIVRRPGEPGGDQPQQ